MERLTDVKINKVINALSGSCDEMTQTFDEVAEYYEWGFTYDDLTTAEEMRIDAALDNAIFNCAVCGWWCDMGDMAENCDEWTCSDCGDK